MTAQRDPDAILAAWLEDGPARLPDADEAGDRGDHPNDPSIAAPDVGAVEVPAHEWSISISLSGRWPSWPSALGGLYVLGPGGGSIRRRRRDPAALATRRQPRRPPTPIAFPTDTTRRRPGRAGHVCTRTCRDAMAATGSDHDVPDHFAGAGRLGAEPTPTMLWHADDHRRVGFSPWTTSSPTRVPTARVSSLDWVRPSTILRWD